MVLLQLYMWFIFTVLAILSRSSFSIFTKILSQDVKVSPVTQSFLFMLCAGVLSIPLAPFLGGISFIEIIDKWYIILGLVLTVSIGNILYFMGIKTLDAGATQIAFSSILIWGAMLSVLFLGSTFSLLQVFGIGLMLFAILFVQYKKTGITISSGIIFIVLSAVLFALFQVGSAALSKVISIGTYLFIVYFAPSIITFILYFKTITKDFLVLNTQKRRVLPKILLTGTSNLLYIIFSFAAYQYAPDRGVVVVLLTGQVILSILFGIIFLKERDNQTKKIISGILAFIAGILIKGI